MLKRWLTLPNVFSEFRILAAPFLLLLAWNGYENWFLGLLALALFSDAIDGYLARELHETTELGARLDSWGDLTIFATVPLSIWWLWPDIIKQELIFIVVALSSYIVPLIIGFIKFKRLPNYHTWAAKTAAVMMTGSLFALLLLDYPWPFRVFSITLIIVGIEEIAITLTLSNLHKNVRSYWHVRKKYSF